MATCQLELLYVGVTVIPKKKKEKRLDMNWKYPLNQLLPARMRSLRACQKWLMCTQPVCARRCCQSSRQCGRRMTVRPSSTLVCQSSELCHVPQGLDSSITRLHLDASGASFLRAAAESLETPSSLSPADDRLVMTQT